MTRFPDGRGHASVTALVFRVALLLGMLLAFWLAAQWWDADRADAATAFPGTEGTDPAAEVTRPDPLVEPITIRSGNTAGEVAERIAGTDEEEAPEPTAVDVDPAANPLESAIDPPDTAELVSESIEKAAGGARPEDCDSSRELLPDGGSARETAGAPGPATAGSTTSNAPRRADHETQRTAPRDHDDEPRAAADPASHEGPRNSGVTLPARDDTARAVEDDPDTIGSADASTREEKSGQPPEHPRPTPLPAPVEAPSTAQVVQPNTGSGQRDVHGLHLEPLRLPTVTGTRTEQEHEGPRSGIKAAVPVTAPD